MICTLKHILFGQIFFENQYQLICVLLRSVTSDQFEQQSSRNNEV